MPSSYNAEEAVSLQVMIRKLYLTALAWCFERGVVCMVSAAYPTARLGSLPKESRASILLLLILSPWHSPFIPCNFEKAPSRRWQQMSSKTAQALHWQAASEVLVILRFYRVVLGVLWRLLQESTPPLPSKHRQGLELGTLRSSR